MDLPPSLFLEDDEQLEVRLKPNPRARRLILRLDAKTGQPVVTVPVGMKPERIRQFLISNKDWLLKTQRERPSSIPFSDEAIVPVRGVPHRLLHVGQRRGTVRVLEQHGEHCLMVSGDAGHMGRRVQDWLKAEARKDLTEAVDRHAAILQVKPAALKIKDTTSRWGSCSSGRVLSFSWRVIMAPPFVLDYLAAHEVSHLREMNHSDRFWALVAELSPNYEKAKRWFRQHGHSLQAYGRADRA